MMQKIFKKSYFNELKDNVESGRSIDLYKGDTFEIDISRLTFMAGVEEPDGLSEGLDPKDDYNSAIKLYNAYRYIPRTIAIKESFWAYLTHTSMFHYTQQRWPDLENSKNPNNYIRDHWFINGNSVLRNAASSLWWSVKNTIVEENVNDPYELTKVMFENYTMRTVTLGAYVNIRNREFMIGFLKFLKDNPKLRTEERIAFMNKYLNRLGGIKQFTSLNHEYFYNVLDKIKDKTLSITNRDDHLNEDLYTDIII